MSETEGKANISTNLSYISYIFEMKRRQVEKSQPKRDTATTRAAAAAVNNKPKQK